MVVSTNLQEKANDFLGLLHYLCEEKERNQEQLEHLKMNIN